MLAWQREPIILASRSASRQAMLTAAGVSFEAIPADIDEAAQTRAMQAEQLPSAYMALALARAKAEVVSAAYPDRLVLGSDSIAVLEPDWDAYDPETDDAKPVEQVFDKPATRDEAAAHLAAFSMRSLRLDSGVAIARNGRGSFVGGDKARVRFRHLSPEFIEHYLDAEWPAIAGCVGCFRMEGLGPHLFLNVSGDYFTILGMPLFVALGALRANGALDR